MWEQFDYKYVLCYTGQPERLPHLKSEFARVGLKDVEFSYNAPNPFDDASLKCFTRTVGIDHKPSMWSASVSHYRVLKAAYARGVQNVLGFESDVVFLKDVSAIEATLNAAPSDYDFLFLGAIIPGGQHRIYQEVLVKPYKVSEYWSAVPDIRGMHAFAMSRSGMKLYVDAFESMLQPDRGVRICDQLFMPPFMDKPKLYVTVKDIAIQDDDKRTHIVDRGFSLDDYNIRPLSEESPA